MNYFIDITTTGNATEIIENLPDDTLLVYSPTSLNMAGISIQKPNMINYHTLIEDVSAIKALCNDNKYRQVISIGGGSAIDAGKYAATLYNCEFICIPTMLSTNAYATNKAALMKDNKKLTFDAKTPDRIIFDESLISKAGQHNIFGLCDVLSIHTALYDWKLAERSGKEHLDQATFHNAIMLLEKTISFISNLKPKDDLDLRSIYEIVGESGHITNMYGNGRPESGSEHIFAREIERNIDVHHGIGVSAGIILMSALQNNQSSQVLDCLDKLGTVRAIHNSSILKSFIRRSLRDLRPRHDRYTILDLKTPSDYGLDALWDLLEEPHRAKEAATV